MATRESERDRVYYFTVATRKGEGWGGVGFFNASSSTCF